MDKCFKTYRIDELKLTTRDISDYNVLMKRRLELLQQYKLTLHDVQNVISLLKPLPGAMEFVDWLRSVHSLLLFPIPSPNLLILCSDSLEDPPFSAIILPPIVQET